MRLARPILRLDGCHVADGHHALYPPYIIGIVVMPFHFTTLPTGIE